jgi:hypothetical protein
MPLVMLVWPNKDPDEIAIRFVDWRKHPSWIDRDTITSASFSLSTAAGMSIDSSDNDGLHTSNVTLSGGTDESVGKVLCEVVTDAGQTLQQTATILVRSR